MNIIARVFNILLEVLQYAILANVILSYLPISRDNMFSRIVYQLTEPILEPIRNLLDKSFRMRDIPFDISPIIAFFLIRLLQNIL